ncbi:hypothetical protein VNO78_00739 [Psophocarpus tetragonolobus]|uniref:Uncharacterized protein n=1 Tax=Psophocarpus tetragonolobus TaxID=3891 RepID=A0AAN9SZR4_PSOTE
MSSFQGAKSFLIHSWRGLLLGNQTKGAKIFYAVGCLGVYSTLVYALGVTQLGIDLTFGSLAGTHWPHLCSTKCYGQRDVEDVEGLSRDLKSRSDCRNSYLQCGDHKIFEDFYEL